MATDRASMRLDEEIHGLDALDIVREEKPRRAARVWSAMWPKLAAVAGVFAVWQIVVWTHWKTEFVLPGPATVLSQLGRIVKTSEFWHALATTMRRAMTVSPT